MKKLSLITFLLASTFCSVAQTTTVTASTNLKSIEVTGSAEMEVVPDEIYIGITLMEYYNKQKEKVSIDDISKNFLATCEKSGITKDRIEVQSMNGFDNTPWWNKRNKKQQPDLMQTTVYLIKFSSPAEVDKLVNVLDDNATQNLNINKVSNSKQAEFRKQLKVQALQNAKTKAQYLLEGIGEKLGGVTFVKEIEQGEIYPRYSQSMMMSNSAAMDGGSSANEGINFKKIKYRYEMEAHFAIQ